MIIGLTGYAQSGKDTVGKILVEEHGFERIAFADALRDCLYALDPIIGSYGDGEWPFYADDQYDIRLSDIVDSTSWDEAKQREPEVRRLLQVLGTEVGREIIDLNVWVKIAMRKMTYRSAVGWQGNYVFTDVRFPNEVQAILNYGGSIWRIERPGFEPVNTHSSETALDDIPGVFHVQNEGSIEALADLVKLVVWHEQQGTLK